MNVTNRGTILTVVLLVAVTTANLGSALPLLDEDSAWMPTHGTWLETQDLSAQLEDELPDTFLNFGGHVDIDGDTLIVSTQFEKYKDQFHSCEDGCDWVYVFNRDEAGTWSKTQKLRPAEPEAGDAFGFAVAVDEDSGVIAVGNPGYRVRDGSEYPGLQRKVDQLHIFERGHDGVWEEAAIFHRPAPQPLTFGYNVAVSGERVISGYSPYLFIFEKRPEGWIESEVLEGSHILAMVDDRIVTGVRYYIEDCLEERWYYQVYDWDGTHWIPIAVLDPQAENGDRAYTGASRLDLSEDGRTLAMGSPMDRRVLGMHTQYCLDAFGGYNAGPLGAQGSGWIYEEVDGEWVETADLHPIPSPGPMSSTVNFGISAGVSGDTAIFGAVGDPYSGDGPNSGAVYVYQKAFDAWALDAKLQKRGAQAQEWFGHSSAISDGTIVAGADWTGQNGSAHVFERWVDP